MHKIITAVRNNNEQMVSRLIEEGVNVNIFHNEPLRVAAEYGYLSILKKLLAAGANVHTCDDEPLRLAVGNGHLEIVQELLAAGANTRAYGNCALNTAVRHGHLEIVQELIQAGADVNIGNSKSNNPLSIAASHGHLEIVQELIKAGADVNKIIEYQTALLHACENGHLEIVQALLCSCSNIHPDEYDNYEDHPLCVAADSGHLEIMQMIMVNCAYNDKLLNYALYLAASNGYLNVVIWLLNNGANSNGCLIDCVGECNCDSSPLECAVENNHIDVVQYLLSAGANVNIRYNVSLGIAAQNNNIPMMQLLLNAGANVNDNCANDDDYTTKWNVLSLSINYLNGDNIEAIQMLIDVGADVRALDNAAMKDAIRVKNDTVIQLLMSAGKYTFVELYEIMQRSALAEN